MLDWRQVAEPARRDSARTLAGRATAGAELAALIKQMDRRTDRCEVVKRKDDRQVVVLGLSDQVRSRAENMPHVYERDIELLADPPEGDPPILAQRFVALPSL